ncbi:ankyrin repeat domain-containing protein [Actinomadura macra]|uniref:ankyrin repeat domain-containing protein n=1 Tax=Actinomadura macra TaxID=46164 RepID=UPI000A03F2A2
MNNDVNGDTLLHYAYHGGAAEVIDLLISHGADETRRNGGGLVPAQKRDVAVTEPLLVDAAVNLSLLGTWVDRRRGQAVYDRLVKTTEKIYLHALQRTVNGDRSSPPSPRAPARHPRPRHRSRTPPRPAGSALWFNGPNLRSATRRGQPLLHRSARRADGSLSSSTRHTPPLLRSPIDGLAAACHP